LKGTRVDGFLGFDRADPGQFQQAALLQGAMMPLRSSPADYAVNICEPSCNTKLFSRAVQDASSSRALNPHATRIEDLFPIRALRLLGRHRRRLWQRSGADPANTPSVRSAETPEHRNPTTSTRSPGLTALFAGF